MSLTIKPASNGWLLERMDAPPVVILDDETGLGLLFAVHDAICSTPSRYSERRLTMGVVPGDKCDASFTKKMLRELVDAAPISLLERLQDTQVPEELREKLVAAQRAYLEFIGALSSGCGQCGCGC